MGPNDSPRVVSANARLILTAIYAKEKAMRAAIVHQFGQPLTIEDWPVPDPGPGQITVRMEASGVCHTDIHAAHGDWPVKPTPPFVPGHEGVAIGDAVGDGVTSVVARDRGAVPWLGYARGTVNPGQTGCA